MIEVARPREEGASAISDWVIELLGRCSGGGYDAAVFRGLGIQPRQKGSDADCSEGENDETGGWIESMAVSNARRGVCTGEARSPVV